jgi:RNA-binding protein YlmH
LGGNDEERLLIARALDKVQTTEKSWEMTLGDFHDPTQAALIRKVLAARQGETQVFFFGGYMAAERVRACFARPDWPPREDDFSLSIIRVFGDSRFFSPTHRDVLGAVMNIGIRREKIGDVVIHAGEAFVVMDAELAAQAVLESVGRSPVSTEIVGVKALQDYSPVFTSYTAIAASLRLDAVVAAVHNLSRSEAALLVNRGAVKLNHVPCTSGAKEIRPGDLVSVRGYGRAYLREVAGQTQRGRLRIRVDKPVQT